MKTTLSLLAAAAALGSASLVHAQSAAAPIKVGLMLPATGTFAALGDMIEKGFRLHVQEQGGKLAGREIQYFRVDDESDPSKATDNVNKLIKRDQVDVIVGTVHSGVALAMAKAAKESNTLLIVPNAGADAITGPMCAPGIVRSSFSNWQPGYATGVVAAQKGYKRAMTITWNYAAGKRDRQGFTEAFEKGGGQGAEGPEPALPERRVPGPAHRDRSAEARCGVRLLRRWRRGQVRQGLRRSRPDEKRATDGFGLPHDGTLEAQGRVGPGAADRAALRRQPGHASQQQLPQELRAGLQGQRRRLRGAGL